MAQPITQSNLARTFKTLAWTFKTMALFTLLLSFSTSAIASPTLTAPLWHIKSSEHATLIELYTSQGCSSCVPADRWISTFKDHDQLWETIFPISMHVTYWNYIGWADPFGHSEHDRRHRLMARHLRAGVYTPGMFLNGNEWRHWRRGSEPPLIPAQGTLEATANINKLLVTYIPDDSTKGKPLEGDPVVYVAYLKSGVSTHIRAGENKGLSIQHDFIAKPLVQHPLVKTDDDQWQLSFEHQIDRDDDAIVLWVGTKKVPVLAVTGKKLSNR